MNPVVITTAFYSPEPDPPKSYPLESDPHESVPLESVPLVYSFLPPPGQSSCRNTGV